MKELFKSNIEIIEFFKKFFMEKRKKELENEPKLVNKLNEKAKILNNKLKLKNINKNKINKQLEKIQNIKNGKIQIINVNRYILRFLLIILFYIAFLNVSLNLKGYNYFIYISAVIITILSFVSMIITIIIKKKVFTAYYYNYDLKKIFLMIILSLGIGYFLNSYKNQLEVLNRKSILIKNAQINSINDLKNSTIEIVNKDGKIKWKVNKNLKILTYENFTKGNINIKDTVIDDNNKVNLSFINEKSEIMWLKGKIIYFNWDTVKIKLKNKKTVEGEVYGKIIKLETGETLILNNNFELRDTSKQISDFGVMGTKLKIKKAINNFLFIFLIILILIEYEYYNFPFEEKEKIIINLMIEEKNKIIIKKSVFSILRTIKLLMIPIALIQTFLIRNFLFNLFFDNNLKKGYDVISVVFLYFSKSYFLIFIILLLPLFTEIFKILKLIEQYIKLNGVDRFSHQKKKRNYSRRMTYNSRKNDNYINNFSIKKFRHK